MSRVEIVGASRAHVGPIATRMRAADRMECAAYGMTPKAALRSSLRASSLALTALVDGKPEAMMGLEVRSAIEGCGAPWMLATDIAYRHGRSLLSLGPRILAMMADSTPHLSNLVSADNPRAIRMLRRWGFEVGSDAEMIGGLPFVQFRQSL